MALPLHTHGKIQGLSQENTYKVLDLSEALESSYDAHDTIVLTDDHPEVEPVLLRNGFAGVLRRHGSLDSRIAGIFGLDNDLVVGAGDAIRVKPSNGMISVLYRRGANANSLFVTEQCNSLCRMCSQPPRAGDNSWRVNEILNLVRLIDPTLPVLGITGGEPTLLGEHLCRILSECRDRLPDTALHVLSNGRTFSNAAFADEIANVGASITWGIPLYSDISDIHDYVTGAPGSFIETINGILNMAERGASIEVRVVLHALTIERLPNLAQFIARNLPFVRHIALMGLEPMGLAKRNMSELWIDPVEYADVLADTVEDLDALALPVSIYNVPLCVIPPRVWSFARQSISDWKNFKPAQCGDCRVSDDCAGFFISAGAAWISRGIAPY